ncbi:uncharacterized protein I303_102338 [Kwoniella dejecticola CBS 10117]|uniref:F-box domain-containing protein n=1 Tax=Kwoniella dejecticola CBS 10117 TaxID=1296121 RepID=A0A1A6AB86_9TREE|nr:uncharacterized protein I303_01521 [Kwoniella dejecticola CBS 10117]OBR87319.1 hypothetical protein I303_01521 [Kwoniella dejecticola CBS 10117]
MNAPYDSTTSQVAPSISQTSGSPPVVTRSRPQPQDRYHPSSNPSIARKPACLSTNRPPGPGRPITFADLTELQPLILSYLKAISPISLLPVSRSLYSELLPKVYRSISLDKHNASLLFHGYSPLTSSRGLWRNTNHSRTRLRQLRDFQPLPGRRSRSSPPDTNSTFSIGQDHEGETGTRGRGVCRKTEALSMTQEISLKDAESLSVICQVHMELLSYSPIATRRSIGIGIGVGAGNGRLSEDDDDQYEDGTNPNTWPLKNVKTLKVGWELIKYLAESHEPPPGMKVLPICCIPFENVNKLDITLGSLGRVRKRFLRRAISELASEFTLVQLVLRVEIPVEVGAGMKALKDGHGPSNNAVLIQQAQEAGPTIDNNAKSDGDNGEIYIPPIEHPPPASEILVVLHPTSDSANPRPVGCSKRDVSDIDADSLIHRLANSIHTFLEDTGRRNFRIPKSAIATPHHEEVERLVRNKIVAGDGLGVARSVGRRAFVNTTFTSSSDAQA